MEAEFLETLAKFRMVIGYLGEKEQMGWWQSSFFTQGSDAFLSPLFSRTMTLARCNGVTRAATLVHDERIGVGHVYHLFRLPEDIEQGIHQVLHNDAFTKSLQKYVSNYSAALDFLRNQASPGEPDGVGPIRTGDVEALRNPEAWRQVASAYLYAFEHDMGIFPYFTDVT